jgi:hypothetical protein
MRENAEKEFEGWQVDPRWIELACPTCSRSVVVLEGCQAWCPCIRTRVEMKAEATARA